MQQSSQYQLKLINQTIRNDVTYYTIQVVNTSQKLSWQFEERYKNMLALHDQIKQLTKTVPSFPPKKLFGNTDPEFISQRKAGLQNYFKILLQHVDVEKILPLKEFLTRGQPKQVRESQTIQSQSELAQNIPKESNNINSNQMIQVQQQKQNIKTYYEKISNETNGQFIDINNMITAPEENDIEKKRQLYEQVKIDFKVNNIINQFKKQIDNSKNHMPFNPDFFLMVANPTLEFKEPDFFKLMIKLEDEINKIFE